MKKYEFKHGWKIKNSKILTNEENMDFNSLLLHSMNDYTNELKFLQFLKNNHHKLKIQDWEKIFNQYIPDLKNHTFLNYWKEMEKTLSNIDHTKFIETRIEKRFIIILNNIKSNV